MAEVLNRLSPPCRRWARKLTWRRNRRCSVGPLCRLTYGVETLVVLLASVHFSYNWRQVSSSFWVKAHFPV